MSAEFSFHVIYGIVAPSAPPSLPPPTSPACFPDLVFCGMRTKQEEKTINCLHGFVTNGYDSCIMSKSMHSKPCTAGWHIYDIKILHCDQVMVKSIVSLLEQEIGKETPLAVTRGNVHKYLGMTIDFSQPGKVKFSMPDYIQGMVDECPEDLRKGSPTTPAANHQFQVNSTLEKLNLTEKYP